MDSMEKDTFFNPILKELYPVSWLITVAMICGIIYFAVDWLVTLVNNIFAVVQ